MISSRKQDKVTDTVAALEKEPGCTVKGVVCHVAKPEHRKNLIKEVKKLKSCKLKYVLLKLYLNIPRFLHYNLLLKLFYCSS